jgi:glycosyltransferase involved in cell wall biosynthesis
MGKPVIFINGSNVADAIGGGPSYARVHARAALRLGFEPHIFCPAPRDDIFKTDFGIVHLVASPFRPFGAVLSAGHAPLLAESVERFLSGREGPHLIHCFIWWRVGLIVRRKLRRKGIEAVAINGLYTTADHEIRAKLQGINSAHGIRQRLRYHAEGLWTRMVIEREERQIYRNARLLTYNYNSVRDLFRERHGEGAEMRKLPYTSESAFLNEFQGNLPAVPEAITDLRAQDAPLIVAISRHDPRKGLDVFLRALAELRAAGTRFRACLVGGGPLLESHRRMARRLGLENAVAITGRVDDPLPYLHHADVFALPSIQEGSGSLSLIEALQAGLPIIASNIDGIPEDVTYGDSALLVEAGTVSGLSQAIERVLTDHALRQRLARRAREVFIEKFSADAFTNAIRETYAELGMTPN